MTPWLQLTIIIWLDRLTIMFTLRLTRVTAALNLLPMLRTKWSTLLPLLMPTLVTGLLSTRSPGLVVRVWVSLICPPRLQGRWFIGAPWTPRTLRKLTTPLIPLWR